MAEENGDMTLAIVGFTVLILIFGGLAFAVLRMTGQGEEEGGKEKQRNRSGRQDAADDDDQAGDEDGTRARRRTNNEEKERRRQERDAANAAAREAREKKEKALAEKQAAYYEKQAKKDAEFEKKEEAEKKARDEKEKKEQEEFDKYKDLFTAEVEGENDGNKLDVNTLEHLIEYVKVRKLVALEDLAAEFRIRTSVAVDNLKELERKGRISGIFDDRGRFIYVTVEEMASVAEWLKSKGRINRSDLVAACNQLVRLIPTDQDKAKLEKEASQTLEKTS